MCGFLFFFCVRGVIVFILISLNFILSMVLGMFVFLLKLVVNLIGLGNVLFSILIVRIGLFFFKFFGFIFVFRVLRVNWCVCFGLIWWSSWIVVDCKVFWNIKLRYLEVELVYCCCWELMIKFVRCRRLLNFYRGVEKDFFFVMVFIGWGVGIFWDWF